MQLYDYTAKDSATGKVIKANVQANSEQEAAKLIHDEGLTPLDIKTNIRSGEFSIPALSRKKVKAKEKILFSRQLSTLVNAGLPLVQALRNVMDQTQGKAFKLVLEQVINDIEAGSALSAAMAKHPRVFNQVYVSLVEAGETSGSLDKSLERLALQQEKDADVISKVRGAFVYPLIVMLVMVAVVIYMLLTVLPQVKVLYEGMGGVDKLPFFTKLLLGVSDLIKHFWWALAIILGVASFFMTRWARTGPGKLVVDRLKMKTPLIGPLFMKMYMARFTRTGSTLIGSGVQLITMLEITGQAVNNVHIQASLIKATEKVKGGQSLSDALQGDPNFLELVPNMLSIGEKSGSTEQMLAKTADYYEKEVDQQIKTVSTVIEPFLMVVMGVMALIIVAAVLLPVYSISGDSITQ